MNVRVLAGRCPALSYGAFSVFGLAVVMASTQPLHRTWGACAAAAYAAAALISAARFPRWLREAAPIVAAAGVLIAPLCWLAATGRGMPEVTVVAHSASQLIHHFRPYESSSRLGADVNGYNPYLPGMTLFGVPRALFGGGVLTDPRMWDGIAFVALFGFALRVARARRSARKTLLLVGSPLIAFPLTVSGNDLPVVGLICLGLALAARPSARGWLAAGLVLGAAAALKATAWPALVVVGVMLLARDGRAVAWQFVIAALAVLGAVTGPFLVSQPGALIENTIAFPLGLTKAHSPAASPLPGHLLAATGPAGHAVVIALMAAAAAGIGVALVVRPPRSVAAAAGYLALALTALFTLAPATRWGYFCYPLCIGCWLWMSGRWPARGQRRLRAGAVSGPPGGSASGCSD